ncbi:MAG: zinc metalloprotease HtpX [Cyanobacteria bacterium P01_F01_bin.53]
MTAATTDLERLFKAGVTAYKAGDYAEAIAALSQLCSSSSRPYRIKAGMGLVRTYMAQKDWSKAKALCHKLADSSKPSVQQWSKTMLTKIESRSKAAASSSALNPETSPAETLAKPASNLSGFQPLSPEAVARPFKKSAADSFRAVRVPHSEPSSAMQPQSGDTQGNAFDDATDEPIEPQGSIFQYDYLNGEISDSTSGHADEAMRPVTPLSEQMNALHDHEIAAAEHIAKQEYEWVSAGRLPQGRALGKMKRSQLWFAQLGGVIVLYFLLRFLQQSAISIINTPLRFLDELLPFWVRQIPFYHQWWSWYLLAFLAMTVIASPWLWDWWLRFTAARQTFSNQKLRTYSPEAATLIGKYCRKRGWPLPTLWKLPTDVPVIFSYGWLPRNARLVVSEGLLTQLEADEIATLVAYELTHWKTGYWLLLSLQGLLLQLFHQSYWKLALWGNRQPKYFRVPVGVLSTLSYCVFWFVRIPGLWVSRIRTYYGDRAASELTGNPNGLTRALAKLSFGLAASVEDQGYTPAMLESTALLLPVAPDLARYPLYGQLPLSQFFAWDSSNPLRAWMSVGDAHPPLGDRIRLMMAYAQYWKLTPEIQLPPSSRRPKGLTTKDWQLLLSQATPFIGLTIGLGIGILLWLIGAVAHQLGVVALDWMYNDSGLFQCCLLLGLGVGTILRVNRFFPDLSMGMPLTQDLAPWLSEPDFLPVNSLATKLSGTVIGRPGLANWLGQDLLLKTPMGLYKLHYFSMLGPLGNVLGLGQKAVTAIGETVQVLGWFRRGTRPWLDIDRVRLSNGVLLQAGHPLFSVLVASIFSLLGLWLLIQSNG